MRADRVVRLDVGRLSLGGRGRRTTGRQGLPDVRERLPELVGCARPEAWVEEGAGVGVGRTPAEQMDAVELAGFDVGDERVLRFDDQLGADTEVGEQLGLERLRDPRRIGQVWAWAGSIGDGRIEPVRIARGREQFPGQVRVVAVPRWSRAAVRDGAWRVVGGDLGAGREEGVDEALAVDADGDRLADLLVVERREGVVEAKV